MSFPGSNVFPDTVAITPGSHLEMGGVCLVTLAQEMGTPLYVYDEATLRARCREYTHEFTSRHPDTLVAYASKAYLNLALVKLFREEGLGLDAVSGGELALGLRGGMSPERIYFHGNNKTPDELQLALEKGCGRVVVDSFHELALLDRLAGEAGRRQDVLLRVSPGVDPHTHHHTTTGVLDSKFGFPIQTGQASEAAQRALQAPNLNLVGLHFHLGSPIFETEPYEEAIRRVMAFAAEHRGQGLELREFSPGGGFAVRYTRDQEPPSVARYADVIVSAMRRECQRHGFPLPRLIVEPGRAITGPAGVAIYRVGAIKDIPGVRTYVSVDGGMGDNIRPALYDAAYEAVVANKMNDAPSRPVTIAGKFCESGDILVRDFPLPEVESGDFIAIPVAGAYAPAMASTYNMVPRPAIALVKDGEARLIRRRETYDDLMRLDLP